MIRTTKELRWKPAKWPAGFRGSLYFATFWAVFAFFMAYMTLEYSRRGLTGVEVGMLQSINSFVVMLVSPLVSRFADKRRIRVKVLVISLILFGFSLVMIYFPQTFWTMLLFVVLMAIARAPIDPIGNALTVRMANRYQYEYGHMRLWGSITYGVFSIFVGYLWQEVGFRWMYLVGGAGVFLIALVASFLEEPSAEDRVAVAAPVETVVDLAAAPPKPPVNWPLTAFFTAYFLMLFGLNISYSFSTLYLDWLGADESVIGMVTAILGFAGIPMMYYGSRISRRFGEIQSLIAAGLVAIVGIASFGLVRDPRLLVYFCVLRGLSWGLILICSTLYVDRLATEETASTYQSILVTLMWLSAILSGPISGRIFDTNPPLMFLVGGLVACAAVGAFAVSLKLARKNP